MLGGGLSLINLDKNDLSGATLSPGNFYQTLFDIKDENGSLWKLFLGYEINDYFSLEASYSDLGYFKGHQTINLNTGGALSLVGPRSTSADAISLSFLGRWRLSNNLLTFVNIGVANSNVKTVVSNNLAISTGDGGGVFTGDLSLSIRETNEWNPKVGAGIKFDFTEKIDLRFEYERYFGVGNSGCGTCTGESDIDAVTFEVIWDF